MTYRNPDTGQFTKAPSAAADAFDAYLRATEAELLWSKIIHRPQFRTYDEAMADARWTASGTLDFTLAKPAPLLTRRGRFYLGTAFAWALLAALGLGLLLGAFK